MIPRRLVLSGIGLLIGCGFSMPAVAAFLNTGVTARSAALGGSAVAMADDAAALAVNPAGLALLKRAEVVADYSRPYTGLSDGSEIAQFYLGYAYPLTWGGSLALGWKELDFADLYKERTLSLGYGRVLTHRLSAGVALKQLHHAFTVSQQIVDDFGHVQSGTPALFAENGSEQNAYSVDLGLLYGLSDQTRLALSIQDINEPNIALSSADRDVVRRTVRLGWASEIRPGMTSAFGVHTRENLAGQRDWIGTAGIERWFQEKASNQWGIRGSFAVGNREYRELVTGAGYRLNAFQLDYAFALNLSGIVAGDTYGTHRFSIAYRFGKPDTAMPMHLATIDKAALASLIEMLNPEGTIAR